MAILLPNYLQTGKYSAKKDRRVNSAEVMREGIVRKGHFALAQRAAGANMSVDVAAGEAWVKGDSATDQGYYHVVNDATVNVPLTAASGSNPRVDTIVLAVNDSTEVGGSDSYLLEALAGTPTAAATLANLKGVAAVGSTKLILGYVLVATSATKVETAAMGGLKDPISFFAEQGTTKAEPFAIAGAPPQYAHGRPLDYVPTCILSILTSNVAAGTTTPVYISPTNDLQNNDTMHAGTSAEILCKTPGLYAVAFGITFTAGRPARAFINKNGSIINGFANEVTTSGTTSGLSVTAFTRAGFGDNLTGVILNGAAEVATNGFTTAVIWQGP